MSFINGEKAELLEVKSLNKFYLSFYDIETLKIAVFLMFSILNVNWISVLFRELFLKQTSYLNKFDS